MNNTFRFRWKGCHTGINGTQDIEHIVLLIRHIDLASKRIIIHRTKDSSVENLTHFSSFETYGVNAPLACSDVYRLSRRYAEILWSIRKRNSAERLMRLIIEIVNPSVLATHSWLEVLPFILDPAVRATANPYTGPFTPKVFRILQFVGSSTVTCADPLPAAYKVFISGSIASSEGFTGRCAVQNIRPVPVLITDTCPTAGCET